MDDKAKAKQAKREKKAKKGQGAPKNIPSQVWAVLAGIVQLVVGVLLLIDATKFTSSIVAVAGVLMMVAGLMQGVRYFRTPVAQAVAGHNLTYALGLLILGGFCVFQFKWITAAMPLMSMVFGVVIILGAILRSQWAVDMLRQKRGYWFVPAIGAVAAYALGAVVLSNPFAAAHSMWVCVAVTFIVGTVSDVAAGVLADKVRPTKVVQPAGPAQAAAVPAIAAADATYEPVEGADAEKVGEPAEEIAVEEVVEPEAEDVSAVEDASEPESEPVSAAEDAPEVEAEPETETAMPAESEFEPEAIASAKLEPEEPEAASAEVAKEA